MTVKGAWTTLEATLHGRPVLHQMRAGEGVPLLLVHGIGPGTTGETNFGPLIDALPEDCPVHIIDLAGLGASARKSEQPGFDVDLWLEQIEQALDRIGTSAVLVGNSVGGALALKTAARRRDLIGAIAIGAAAAASPATPELRAFWRAPTSPQALAEAMRPMTAAAASPPEPMVMARWSVFADPGYAAWFNATLERPDECLKAAAVTADEAARIAGPVHLLHGREDRACPVGPLVSFVLDHLPTADLTLLGACGHNVVSERTADVLAAVNQQRTKGFCR